MGIVYVMLIVSLAIALFFLIVFLWAIKNGQFDDDYTPSVRVLFDDEPLHNQDQNKENKEKKIKTNKIKDGNRKV